MKFREHIDTIIITVAVIGSAFGLGAWMTAQQNRMDDRFYDLLNQVHEAQQSQNLSIQELKLTKADKK